MGFLEFSSIFLVIFSPWFGFELPRSLVHASNLCRTSPVHCLGVRSQMTKIPSSHLYSNNPFPIVNAHTKSWVSIGLFRPMGPSRIRVICSSRDRGGNGPRPRRSTDRSVLWSRKLVASRFIRVSESATIMVSSC
jgi:hypothetical protein